MKDFNIGKLLNVYMQNAAKASKCKWRNDEKFTISLLYHELYGSDDHKAFISSLIDELKDVNLLEICSVQLGRLLDTDLRRVNSASLVAEELFERKQETDMIDAYFLEKSSPFLASLSNVRMSVAQNFAYIDNSLRSFDPRSELVLSLPDLPDIKTETITARFKKGNPAVLALKLMRMQYLYCIKQFKHIDADYDTLVSICSGKAITFSADEKKKEFRLEPFPFQSTAEKAFMPAYPLWQAKQHLVCLLKSEVALAEILIAAMEK